MNRLIEAFVNERERTLSETLTGLDVDVSLAREAFQDIVTMPDWINAAGTDPIINKTNGATLTKDDVIAFMDALDQLAKFFDGDTPRAVSGCRSVVRRGNVRSRYSRG